MIKKDFVRSRTDGIFEFKPLDQELKVKPAWGAALHMCVELTSKKT
jgi:hypothetical protein